MRQTNGRRLEGLSHLLCKSLRLDRLDLSQSRHPGSQLRSGKKMMMIGTIQSSATIRITKISACTRAHTHKHTLSHAHSHTLGQV